MVVNLAFKKCDTSVGTCIKQHFNVDQWMGFNLDINIIITKRVEFNLLPNFLVMPSVVMHLLNKHNTIAVL